MIAHQCPNVWAVHWRGPAALRPDPDRLRSFREREEFSVVRAQGLALPDRLDRALSTLPRELRRLAADA